MNRGQDGKLETFEIDPDNMDIGDGVLCLCTTTCLMGMAVTPETVAAAYVSGELARLGAADAPDWKALGRLWLTTYTSEDSVSTPAELACAFESVRGAWNEVECQSVLRRRLASAMASTVLIENRETFCDLRVTTESVEALARAWGERWWSENVTKAWSYRMLDYDTDEIVRQSLMDDFADSPVQTALTSEVCEMMFALLERSIKRCSERNRVVVVTKFSEFAKKFKDDTSVWDLLGRYLVGFSGGNGILVMPGFEFLTNEKKLSDSNGRSHGPLGNKLLLDYGTTPESCAIDFSGDEPAGLMAGLARLTCVLEAATVLWNDAGGPTYSTHDYEGRYHRPKDPLMVPAEAMRVAAAALS
jgi:hypothetical protein